MDSEPREMISLPDLFILSNKAALLAAVHLVARRIRRRRRIRQPLLPCAFGGAALHPGAPLGDLQRLRRRIENPARLVGVDAPSRPAAAERRGLWRAAMGRAAPAQSDR